MFARTREAIPDTLSRYVPVTVLVLVAVSFYFETSGIRKGALYPTVSRGLLFDPVYHLLNLFLHFDGSHFAWNMRLFVPFGVLLTWLTSNRHVAVVVVTAQLLANVVSGVAGQFVFGASSAALALVAASLVRATGYAMQNASSESVQAVVAGLLSAGSLVLFLVFLASGGTGWVAHFHHFLGFLFGGAVEAMSLFGGTGEETG